MNEDADVENGEPDERRRWGAVLHCRRGSPDRRRRALAAQFSSRDHRGGAGCRGVRRLWRRGLSVADLRRHLDRHRPRTVWGRPGRIGSAHLPGLGIWFLLLIPVIGGLVYGPLIQRFAREARGHGVPEVMIAVAEDGGRIRPQVTAVKAIASALCIGVGGSVGREGPIVQIGSAFASSVGQVVGGMSEWRLRILVACGAAVAYRPPSTPPSPGCSSASS